MKYPKDMDPFNGSTIEFMAWVYGQLAASYSTLAQYERDEKKRETDRIEQALMQPKEREKK